MITRIENEIIQLHQFFQDWYNNQLTPTDKNFARCENVLAPDFSIIFPDGNMVLCQPLLGKLREAHNSHTRMRIWIENIQVLHQIGDLILATYEEWQEIEGTVTARLSSVLFKEAQSTPNGLLWLHVHETWIAT
jgi:hypothetical protein